MRVALIYLNDRPGPRFTTIDESDAALAASYQWHAHVTKTGTIYARSNQHGRATYLHRLLMGFPKGLVDHRDLNGLNNRRSNLRLANRSQNGCNSSIRKHSSRFKGVSWCKCTKRWRATIKVGQKAVKLGRFDDEKAAAMAYDAAARKNFGEFARLNFK